MAAAAALTTPLCAALIAPRVPSALATLVYSVIVASFGLMHLARIRTVAACTRRRPSEREGRWLGLVAGCAGGLVASMTGVGIDMLVYIGMVAYARVDMRVAIPTSVILGPSIARSSTTGSPPRPSSRSARRSARSSSRTCPGRRPCS